MKKITMLVLSVVVLLVFISNNAITQAQVAQKELEIPKYSQTGIIPQIVYFAAKNGHRFPFHNKDLKRHMEELGYNVLIKRIYQIDSTGNGTYDIWHIEYDFPTITREKGEIVRGFTQIELYIGVDKKGQKWERVLIDKFDMKGNLGSDGIFEREIIYFQAPENPIPPYYKDKFHAII